MATPTPGEKLREQRLAQGLHQAQVAEQAGCAVSFVCQLENGYTPKRPSLKLGAVAAAVGASLGSFWP